MLETAGFDAPYVVAQQEQPDADFPTVAFPNPEEPGAMDLAMALAAERAASTWWSPTTPTPTGARPPCPTRTAGGCCAATRSGRCWPTTCCTGGHAGTYACSIVSSSLLGKMAAAAGQPFAETLTGFKWISKVEGLVFGYEEALGYCVDPEHVKDKDGVSALLLLVRARGRREGSGPHRWSTSSTTSPWRTGCTPPTSSRCGSPTWREIAAAMERLRATPPGRAGRARR